MKRILGIIFITIIAVESYTQQQTVTVKQDNNQQYMTTKVYDLNHVKAENLCPFVDGAVKRSNRNASALAAVSDKGQQLIVNMPLIIVKDIDKMVKKLDRSPTPKQINLITTNNDGKVISKTYILNHADPYEIKPLLEAAVGTKRINKANTGIECVRYKDGKGAVIVSAEAYRFQKSKYGINIDELVKTLDKPGVKVNGGDNIDAYFMQQNDARDIKRFIKRMGFEGTKADDERVIVDPDTNTVIIRSAPFRKKTIKKLIKEVDPPVKKD